MLSISAIASDLELPSKVILAINWAIDNIVIITAYILLDSNTTVRSVLLATSFLA